MPRYIDADDAIYELERAFPVDDFGKIIRCISRTPIADVVERKVGKWSKVGGVFRCSNCEKCYPYATDYCPNCGSRMKGENDDKKRS